MLQRTVHCTVYSICISSLLILEIDQLALSHTHKVRSNTTKSDERMLVVADSGNSTVRGTRQDSIKHTKMTSKTYLCTYFTN